MAPLSQDDVKCFTMMCLWSFIMLEMQKQIYTQQAPTNDTEKWLNNLFHCSQQRILPDTWQSSFWSSKYLRRQIRPPVNHLKDSTSYSAGVVIVCRCKSFCFILSIIVSRWRGWLDRRTQLKYSLNLKVNMYNPYFAIIFWHTISFGEKENLEWFLRQGWRIDQNLNIAVQRCSGLLPLTVTVAPWSVHTDSSLYNCAQVSRYGR